MGNIGVIVMVMFTGGMIAGMIAYSKVSTSSTFVAFFFFGALLPLIGIVCAALSGPKAQPAGWYSDPWGVSPLRWFDGASWSGYVA